MNKPLFSFCFTLYIILVIGSGFTGASSKVRKNVEDNDDVNDDGKEMENMEIPAEVEPKNCTRRSNSHMHEIRKASYNQFPYLAALMSSRNEYVCAGSVVANGLILTSGDCATSATYALVNTTSAKKDDTCIVLNVVKVERFPTNDKNVALLYTKKVNNSVVSKVAISNITKAEDVIEVEAIGFGLNAEVGHVKELQYVGLEVGILDSSSSAFISCIDTKVPTCFRDKGGPLLLNNKLVGVITNGQNECTAEMTSKFDVNKLMVNFIQSFVFKAWLNETIAKNNENVEKDLNSFRRTHVREPEHVLTGGAAILETSLSVFLVHMIINVL